MSPSGTDEGRAVQRHADAADEPARSLPIWTWFAPFVLCHLGTWLSLGLQVSPNSPALHLTLPIGLVLVAWWGPRVLFGLYANALLSAPLWGVPWDAAPLLAVPETLGVAVSWLLFMRLARGQCQLPNLRQLVLFLSLGMLVPVSVCCLFVNARFVAWGTLQADAFWPVALSSWIGDALGCLAVSVPALMFLTAPIRRRGWGALAPESGIRSRYLFVRGRPLNRLTFAGSLIGVTLASTVVEAPFVLAGHSLFVLAAAVAGGAGAAALLSTLAVVLTLPMPILATTDFAAWWGDQTLPFSVELQLLVLYTGGIVAGRAISDLTSATDRRRQSEAALRISEERLSDIAGAVSDLFWETGPDLRFSWFSQEWMATTGLRSMSALGKTRWEFAGADPSDPHWAAHIADMQAHRPFRDFRYSVRSERGDLIWLSTSGVPVFDDDGAFVGYRGAATTVTDEVETQRALADSKSLLDGVLESFADGIAVYGPDDRLLLFNENYRHALSGMSDLLSPDLRFEDLLRAAVDRGHIDVPKDADTDAWIAERLREHRTPGAVRSFWTREGRWIEVREYMTRDGATVLFRVDATERKRADEALRESEARLADAIEGFPAAVAVWAPDGTLRLCNSGYRNHFAKLAETIRPGLPSDAFVRKLIDAGYFENTCGDIDVEVARRMEDFNDLPRDYVERYADGRWVAVRESETQEGATICVRIDVSELKQAEEALRESEARMRDAQNMAHFGNWEWEIDTGAEIWSDEVYRILGIDPDGSDPTFETFFDALHLDDRERARARIRAALEDDTPYEVEYRIVRPDGTVRTVEGRGVVHRDAAGRPTRMKGSVIDITDRIQAEKQLRHAQSQKAVGDLASGIAHEINNLLQPILTLTALTRDQLDAESRGHSDLGIVLDAGRRMRDLVKQVLDFSRRDATVRDRLPIADVVQRPLGLLRSTVPSTIELKDRIDPECGVVEADASQMATVVINLVSNAVDAIGGRVGEIVVSVATVDVDPPFAASIAGLRPGRFARLSVSDSGCGIDDATQVRLFDPFFTTKSVGEGTGLGLAATHGIVAAHEGAIDVTSRVGGGARFDVYLPLVDDGGDAEPQSGEGAETENG